MLFRHPPDPPDATEPTEPAEQPAEKAPRRRRRKRRPSVAAPVDEPSSPGATGTFYLAAAVTFIAGLIVTLGVLSPTEVPYALLIVGVAAFFAGATHPRPETMLRLCLAVAAVGLAGLATTTSAWAVAAAISGGIGLGGAIHRLGREGPEGPSTSFP